MGVEVMLDNEGCKALNQSVGARIKDEFASQNMDATKLGPVVAEALGVSAKSATAIIRAFGRGDIRAGPNRDARSQTRDLGKLAIVLCALRMDVGDDMIGTLRNTYPDFTYPPEGYTPWTEETRAGDPIALHAKKYKAYSM